MPSEVQAKEMAEQEPLRFGIIGCGRIAPFHVDALLRVPGVRITAVADVVEAKAEQLAAQVEELSRQLELGGSAGPGGKVAVHTDYRELLARPDVDAVTICTPSGLHPRLGIDAARAGKHVLVEKPMSLTLRGADRLIEAARQSGVKLGVSFQNRFNPTIVRLRQVLESGRFGRLSHGVASVRWRRTPAYYQEDSWRGTWALDGGVLMNQAIHDIDLLQWMMGPVAEVSAMIATRYRPIEAEDVALAAVRFTSGALGSIEAATTLEPADLEETLSIFGERGSVVVGGLALNRLEVWRFADMSPEEEGRTVVETEQAIRSVYGTGHRPLVADFCQAIRENREPLVTGEEGRRAVELVLAIYRSAETGRPVTMPLTEEAESIVKAQEAMGIWP